MGRQIPSGRVIYGCGQDAAGPRYTDQLMWLQPVPFPKRKPRFFPTLGREVHTFMGKKDLKGEIILKKASPAWGQFVLQRFKSVGVLFKMSPGLALNREMMKPAVFCGVASPKHIISGGREPTLG